MLSNANWEFLTVFVGGLATLGIYSFFVKENPVYRFFEHLYIGIAAGFGPVYAIKAFFWPKILEPMLGLDIVQFPDGTFSKEYNELYLLYLIPIAIGLLYYSIYFKRISWMIKIVIGISLGASAGLTFKGFFNEVVPQVTGTFKPLVVFSQLGQIDWSRSLENCFFIITFLLVMNYFFFTFRRTAKITDKASYASRWLMMICFGAFFGSTVQARLMLLIERLEFLINQWFGLLWI